jgi:hypothetical protein
MRLVHFSAEPLGEIVSIPQELRGKGMFKPIGLWVSVEGIGDGWREWCEAEHFALDRLTVETEIILAPKARILRLSSPDDIDAFSEEWRGPPRPYLDGSMLIDWPRLAENYQGIIIAPYIWERRLSDDCRWYYAWDCASGCIWDADAIAEARQLERQEATNGQ